MCLNNMDIRPPVIILKLIMSCQKMTCYTTISEHCHMFLEPMACDIIYVVREANGCLDGVFVGAFVIKKNKTQLLILSLTLKIFLK